MMELHPGYMTRNATAMRSATVPAPKEIGLLQRVEGVRTGLDEICARLYALSCRIDGNGETAGSSPAAPAGLPGNLSECEDRVRHALALIGKLDEMF